MSAACSFWERSRGTFASGEGDFDEAFVDHICESLHKLSAATEQGIATNVGEDLKDD